MAADHGARSHADVLKLGTGQLVVQEAQDKSELFDYCICGVRKSYEQHKVIRSRR